MRPLCIRGIPAAEEGAPNQDRIAEGRAAHHDILRESLPRGKNAAAVCRGLRWRSPGKRVPRDIQDTRGECTWLAGRGDSPFQGARAQG